MVKMIKVRVAVGCPSGTTEDWTDDTMVYIREDMIDYFTSNLIAYARRSREDYDWNPIEEDCYAEESDCEFEIPIRSGINEVRKND
jgi:hypothetical protein